MSDEIGKAIERIDIEPRIPRDKETGDSFVVSLRLTVNGVSSGEGNRVLLALMEALLSKNYGNFLSTYPQFESDLALLLHIISKGSSHSISGGVGWMLLEMRVLK